MRKKIDAGFTLLELLVGIAVIVILAGLIVPVVISVRSRGLEANCISNLRQIGNALHLYSQDWNGDYPPEYLADAILFTRTDKAILRCPADDAHHPSDYKDQCIDNPPSKMTSYVWAGPVLALIVHSPYADEATSYTADDMRMNRPDAGFVACMHHGYYTSSRTKPRRVIRLAFDGSVKTFNLPRQPGDKVWSLEDSLGWLPPSSKRITQNERH